MYEQGSSATNKELKQKLFPLVSAGDVGLPGPAGNDRYRSIRTSIVSSLLQNNLTPFDHLQHLLVADHLIILTYKFGIMISKLVSLSCPVSLERITLCRMGF